MDSEVARCIAAEIAAVSMREVVIAVVVDGNNLVYGRGFADSDLDRVTSDDMGMLATIINALALQNTLEKTGIEARVMSAVQARDVCEIYVRRRALGHLEKGRIVIFSAGTGNPFFTTDAAAGLRASEINAQLMLKATKVDGIYDSDPVKVPDAKLYRQLSYEQILAEYPAVMDATAVVMCCDNGIPIRVFNIFRAGSFKKIVRGEEIETLVSEKHDDD